MLDRCVTIGWTVRCRESPLNCPQSAWGARGFTVDAQVGSGVDEPTIANVDQKIEMSEEICVNDGMANLRHDENPAAWPPETNVQCQRSLTVSSNRGSVCCLEILALVSCRRDDAHLSSCVHEELVFSVAVSYVEKATGRGVTGKACRP